MAESNERKAILERAESREQFLRILETGNAPFWPTELAHVYVKLEFDGTDKRHENAKTALDARDFLTSVGRAAKAAQATALRYNGFLLEVQGSTIHVGIPIAKDAWYSFVGELHAALQIVFHDAQKRVKGWRMTVDRGRTLVVAGRGVHGDQSFVSLGESANRPAAFLYNQLELCEERRILKRHHVAWWEPTKETWRVAHLNEVPIRLEEIRSIAESAKRDKPQLEFFEAIGPRRFVRAQAAPIAPGGSIDSPTPNNPYPYFGWVMRADLDKFTRQVERCFDDPTELFKLAQNFRRIMDSAAEFVDAHKESMAQLPWAGDNFTAAIVFETKSAYEAAIPRRLVEAVLDFEKELDEIAKDSGFGGWAHAVAGGLVHGNATGNVYMAGVEVGGRRFLVGAGEGFGRTTEAFADTSPDAGQLSILVDDYDRLQEEYKQEFHAAKKSKKETSSLFKLAKTDDLWEVRADFATKTVFVSVPSRNKEERQISVRPHYR